MKRVLLVLLCGLLFNTFCMAQASLGNFSQRGAATQDMKTDGLTIAHPSLPIGSKAQVTNVATGKKIDVTVSGRIPASSSRIVDLSPGAASALEIQPGGIVIISVPSPARTRPPAPVAEAPKEEEPKEEPPPEPVAEVAKAEPPKEEPPPPPPPPGRTSTPAAAAAQRGTGAAAPQGRTAAAQRGSAGSAAAQYYG
jgi:rare lipoprotein A